MREGEEERTDLPWSDARTIAWLRDTKRGQTILRKASEKLVEQAVKERLEAECRTCQQLGSPPKVLVVVRRLGGWPGVEVFWEPGVMVRCEELVDSENDAELEVLCETLLRLQLPKPWKHLVDCRSDSMVFWGLSAEGRLEALDTLRVLREYKEFTQTDSNPKRTQGERLAATQETEAAQR